MSVQKAGSDRKNAQKGMGLDMGKRVVADIFNSFFPSYPCAPSPPHDSQPPTSHLLAIVRPQKGKTRLTWNVATEPSTSS